MRLDAALIFFGKFLTDLVFEQPGSVSTENLGVVVVERDLLGGSFGEAIVQCGIEVRG